MPNRIIKDSIHESEKVNAMTDFQFRLWISLITYVDDYGRGDARPSIIKGNCFPLRDRLTNKDIDAALTGLAGIGCIVLYEVDGRPYLYFPNWEQHQTIRNKRSRFPEPPSIENNCMQMKSNASLIQSNPNPNTNPNPREYTRFAPPTREEAEEYCWQKKINVDLEAWFAYYEANGWMVGRQKMKDWKASLRYWAAKEKRPVMGKPGKVYSESPETQAAKMDRLKKVAAAMGGEA